MPLIVPIRIYKPKIPVISNFFRNNLFCGNTSNIQMIQDSKNRIADLVRGFVMVPETPKNFRIWWQNHPIIQSRGTFKIKDSTLLSLYLAWGHAIWYILPRLRTLSQIIFPLQWREQKTQLEVHVLKMHSQKVKPRMSFERTTNSTTSKFGMDVHLLIICGLIKAIFKIWSQGWFTLTFSENSL